MKLVSKTTARRNCQPGKVSRCGDFVSRQKGTPRLERIRRQRQRNEGSAATRESNRTEVGLGSATDWVRWCCTIQICSQINGGGSCRAVDVPKAGADVVLAAKFAVSFFSPKLNTIDDPRRMPCLTCLRALLPRSGLFLQISGRCARLRRHLRGFGLCCGSGTLAGGWCAGMIAVENRCAD